MWKHARPDNDHVSFNIFLLFRIQFHQNGNREQSSTCQTDWKIWLRPLPSFPPFLHFSSSLCSPSHLPAASTTLSFCITHTLVNNEDEVNPTVTSASQTDFIFTDLLQLHHRPLGIPPTHCAQTLYQAVASAVARLDRRYRTLNPNYVELQSISEEWRVTFPRNFSGKHDVTPLRSLKAWPQSGFLSISFCFWILYQQRTTRVEREQSDLWWYFERYERCES